MLLDLTLAAVPFAVLMAATHRLIWPRWKVAGKTAFYFAAVALLSALIGHWSVLLALLHQGTGLAFHVWFCRRHGLVWHRIDDPERYIALSRQAVGVDSPPPSLPGLNQTMQWQGEKPQVEWLMDQ